MMVTNRVITAVVFMSMFMGSVCRSQDMFDPVIDRSDAEWCYAATSTTVIGLPFVPEPIQVTYDGAIYTGYAELSFFYGKELRPVMARNKTFLEGWIPVVGYGWHAGGIDYRLEVFSDELPELGINNLIQFARITMKNNGDRTKEGVIAAAARGSGGKYRKGKPRIPVSPATTFNMDDDQLLRDQALLYMYPDGAERHAVHGTPYEKTYNANSMKTTDRTATGFSIYKRALKPGESFGAVFKMPRVPIRDSEQIEAIRAADYGAHRDRVVEYWRELLGKCDFIIPEKRVNDSRRAALVHLILATRGNNGQGHRQGSGLPYDPLFLNDHMDMMLAYVTGGLPEFHLPNVDWLLEKQHESGMFIDVHNRGNNNIVTSHGQGAFALAYHFIMTKDRRYGERVFPAVKKGVNVIIEDHYSGKHHGLLRPSIPYDAPMVTGYHTCHNLFGLLSLRVAIRMARELGEDQDVKQWTKLESSYRKAILTALKDVYKREGYIRSGLYDATAGWVQGRRGNVNTHPNQDWENNLLVYPTELLAPDDPMVARTINEIRRRKYREGCMSYRNGMHVHQYVTINQAHQYMMIGDARKALSDLYHVLLHNGSTHEGFENLVEPWTNRTPAAGCPPPHAWAAAKTALYIRNMLVCEYGGEAGLNEQERDLHLYSLISPSWIKPGEKVEIRNAPTEMGTISSTLTFKEGGAEIGIDSDFHNAPRYIAVRIPYSVKVSSLNSDAEKSFSKNGILYFTPDVSRVSLKWEEIPGVHDGNFQDLLRGYRSEYDLRKTKYTEAKGTFDPANAGKPFLLEDEKQLPAEPMSFDLVKRAFLKEYKRRFDEYTNGGGTPRPVEPPQLLSASETQELFDAQFKEIISRNRDNLAFLKPTTATALHSSGSYRPEQATDGSTNVDSAYWSDAPASLTIDLKAPALIDRINVITHWNANGTTRVYRYTVSASLDGQSWVQVVDRSQNTVSATEKGIEDTFQPVKARYIKFAVCGGRTHLVEIQVFKPAKD